MFYFWKNKLKIIIMQSQINKEEIQKYLGYLNDFKQSLERGERGNVGKLQLKHDVSIATNGAAKKAGILQIKGRGSATSHKFLVSTIEPRHIRRLLEYLYGEWNESTTKETIKEPVIQEVIVRKQGSSETTIKKYIEFFNTLNILEKSKAKYDLYEIIAQRQLSKSVMKYAIESGLCIRAALGKYVFVKNIDRMNVIKLLDILNEEQNKKLKEYRSDGKCSTVIPKPSKPENDNRRATHSRTIYKIFGVKIMTSETEYFHKD
jgi:hypothetical protein